MTLVNSVFLMTRGLYPVVNKSHLLKAEVSFTAVIYTWIVQRLGALSLLHVLRYSLQPGSPHLVF